MAVRIRPAVDQWPVLDFDRPGSGGADYVRLTVDRLESR